MPGTSHRLQPIVLQAVLDRIAARDRDRAIYRATRGVPYPPRCVRLRRLATLRQAERDSLKAFLKGNLSAYIEEIRDFLYNKYNLRVTISTSAALRRLYLSRIATLYTAEQIVALDKSACNKQGYISYTIF
ncbi:hypothetical protein CC86DRAFT_399123 [Ophiobolus disseminans]|uniref:Uncharacterized protein n=1 Tax=Ophiobolus disseminans TaxID=1469910 RepID=A0A6A6ZBW3_9PLEO|nr:hypothetical protein CC86DRAFT_399123 [Ophiobolus disseminans]